MRCGNSGPSSTNDGSSDAGGPFGGTLPLAVGRYNPRPSHADRVPGVWTMLGMPDARPLDMQIEIEDLSRPDVHALLHEHLADMREQSPPEDVHALDVEGLRDASITFWTVRGPTGLLGCGALKELDPLAGEIKSMRTARAHLRKGVAARLMRHVLEEAQRRDYERLSLETGSMTAFEPARRLYATFGFEPCGPFADYADDLNSVFMTRKL